MARGLGRSGNRRKDERMGRTKESGKIREGEGKRKRNDGAWKNGRK